MSPTSILAILEILSGAMVLAAGIAALRRNASNQIHQVFFAVTTLLFLQIFTSGSSRLLIANEVYVTDVLHRLAECFLLWAGTFLINFANIFPGRGGRGTVGTAGGQRKRSTAMVLYTITAVVVVLNFLNFTPYLFRSGAYNPVTGTIVYSNGPVYYINRLVFLLAVIVALLEQRRFLKFHERDPRRIHSRYFNYGLLAAGAAGLLVVGLAELYALPGLLPAGLAGVCAAWAFLVYKILAYRAIALRGGFFRNAALLVLTGVLVTPIVLLVQLLIVILYQGSPLLLGTTLGLLFVVFQQLMKFAGPRVEAWLSTTARLEDVLSRFNSSILDLKSGDEADVRDRFAEFLEELYEPRFLAIYVRSEHSGELTQVRPLTRIADVESIPPTDFPPEIENLLRTSDSELREGGLLVDLQAFADRREDSEASRLLALQASYGAEVLIPFYGAAGGESLPDTDIETEQVDDESTELADRSSEPSALPRMVLTVGLARGGRPFDHTDLNLLRALRAPTMLAVSNQELLQSTRDLQERLEEENRRIARRLSMQLPGAERTPPEATFVYDPGGPMAAVIAQMEKFAVRDSPVLVTGETGTGKEQLARMLHVESDRTGDLVAVNCSAIPPDLIENELFGHVRGAFTGADSETDGLVARAKNGTLFLDEIGEMPIQGQVKLLRLVQEGQYEKIGASEPITTNARFVFATNRNLLDEVQAGGFREDLYYRISTFEIRIPPLRERRADLPLLIRHFLTRASDNFDRGRITISPEAEEMLLRYSWPGNVRELENLLLRSIVLTESSVLDVDNLPVMFRDRIDFGRKQKQLERIVHEQARLEKELLLEALQRTGGNQRKAAEILRISRGSLQYRMKQYGLVND